VQVRGSVHSEFQTTWPYAVAYLISCYLLPWQLATCAWRWYSTLMRSEPIVEATKWDVGPCWCSSCPHHGWHGLVQPWGLLHNLLDSLHIKASSSAKLLRDKTNRLQLQLSEFLRTNSLISRCKNLLVLIFSIRPRLDGRRVHLKWQEGQSWAIIVNPSIQRTTSKISLVACQAQTLSILH